MSDHDWSLDRQSKGIEQLDKDTRSGAKMECRRLKRKKSMHIVKDHSVTLQGTEGQGISTCGGRAGDRFLCFCRCLYVCRDHALA